MRLCTILLLLLLFSCSERSGREQIVHQQQTTLGTPTAPTPTDSLGYLKDYLGKSPTAANLWQTQPLHTYLQHILGSQYAQFLKTMQHASPLRQDRVLYTSGYQSADSSFAYLLVDVKNNKIHVSIVRKGTQHQFETLGKDFTSGQDLYLPQEIRQQLAKLR